MSRKEAPIYIEAHDLTRWVVEKAATWPAPALLAPQVTQASTELLSSVSQALTFTRNRRDHLNRADEAIVKLRVLLRVARDMGQISPSAHRFACSRLSAIGSMLGGWLRRLSSTNAKEMEDPAPN